MTTLIKNGIAYINNRFSRKDILLKNGKIQKIAQTINLDKVDQIIDASGKYVFPVPMMEIVSRMLN